MSKVCNNRDAHCLLNMNWQRLLSLTIALVYLFVGLIVYPPKSVGDGVGLLSKRILGVLFPLACVWFGDEMGDYTGRLSSVTKASAGWLVRLGGWCLLLLQVIIAGFLWF
jgi:hypothetical protein